MNNAHPVMRDFEADLKALFGEKIKTDDSFCKNVWSALANKIWKNTDGAEFSCTFRYAGGLIAEIRERGNYMDWYCSGPVRTVSEEIEKGMGKLGWTHHDYDGEGGEMKDNILTWFSTGQVGASSKAMALAAAEMPHDRSHPYDLDDMNRCLLLLEAVPEIRDHMGKVAAISDTWSKLVERWDEVEQCFLDEVGLNWSKGNRASRTYELMKSIGC